ncbi:ATP-binding cassette domain-containing protein [Halovenus rubra]|uniref:ATP-binding cassette domain-containing protein n=2 Tax=Halovenus rubra TaxID=869890 RepID=A0ACC7E2A1_9EURY|nr:ABC transporter ATP-binding protein [Halovenus rubra]
MQPTDTNPSRDDENGPGEKNLAITARDIHVTYEDGTEAVQGVDISVRSGEFFGFLGPNGAGKTTTIKTLVTLLHPTQGTVQINGYDVSENPTAVCESIGYMSQETSVDKEFTARENVRFACKIYGVPEGERAQRVDELLELVNLLDVADKRAETFSGGMKKRLDAATALVHQPPVVFLDEPTTGLDPEARLTFWEYLQSINDHGTTVFLTTQYLEEVDRLCDRLSIIQDGQLLTTDTPDSLKSDVGGDILKLEVTDTSSQSIDSAERVVRQSDVFDDPSVKTTESGLRIRDRNARERTSELFVSLHEADITVTGFDIRSPTLDDVFVQLTGEQSNSDGKEPSKTEAEAEAKQRVMK